MNFPPLRLDVDANGASLYVAGLKHSTFPANANLHKVAIDKAFEIVQTHSKDLTLTINDNGKEYRLLLTKNGETIDQTPQETTAPKKSSKKLKLIGYITLATATLATASFLAVNALLPADTHLQATAHNQVMSVNEVTTQNNLLQKSPQAQTRTPTPNELKTKEYEATASTTAKAISDTWESLAKDAKRLADAAKKQDEPDNKTPTPAPQPQPPAPAERKPKPTPAPQPQPPAPEPEPTTPENFITDMSTNAVSGKGSVTFTVRLVGGNAPVTATIAGRTLTFNGTGTISGIPKGTYSWTTYVDGLSNSGTITIP